MSAYVVIVQTENEEQGDRDETYHGPFRRNDLAVAHADAIGRAAGAEHITDGLWIARDEFHDESTGFHTSVSATVTVRQVAAPRVRPIVRHIKAFLRGEADG